VGEAPDAGEGGWPSASSVAGVFFLICGFVTGGFPFSGGVAARDSVWRPSFFGGPSFLPLGAMVEGRRVVPQEGVGSMGQDKQRKEEGLLCYIKSYQENESKLYIENPRRNHKKGLRNVWPEERLVWEWWAVINKPLFRRVRQAL